MPRWAEDAASIKPDKLVEHGDHLEFDDPDEVDEDEEVEYEGLVHDIEYDEAEDEYEDEETEVACQVDAKHGSKVVHADNDEDERAKHAELLALPPHGSELYVGGISSDVSTDDLKKLCESVGEVVEVSTAYFLCASFCICFLLNFQSLFAFLSFRYDCQERVVTSCMLLSISEPRSWL